MSKYNVGDKVKIRSDLITDEVYGHQEFVPPMKQFLGKTANICSASRDTYGCKNYIIDIDTYGGWCFTEEMFEEVNDVVINKLYVVMFSGCGQFKPIKVFHTRELAREFVDQKEQEDTVGVYYFEEVFE
jgi:hypothetical protein